MKRLILLLALCYSIGAGQQIPVNLIRTSGEDTARFVNPSTGLKSKFLTFPDGTKFTTATILISGVTGLQDSLTVKLNRSELAALIGDSLAEYVLRADTGSTGFAKQWWVKDQVRDSLVEYTPRTVQAADSAYKAAQIALKKDKADSVLAVGYYTNEKARVDTVNRNVLIALKKANSDSTLATGYYTNEKARVDTVNRNVLIALKKANSDSVLATGYYTNEKARVDTTERNSLIGKRIPYTDTSSVVANQWWVKDQVRDSLAEYALKANSVLTGTTAAAAIVPSGTSGQFGWWTRPAGWSYLTPSTATDTASVPKLFENQPVIFAGRKMSLISPYTTKTGTYKGQLHTHTTNSDGVNSPTDLVTFYKNHQYDFVAITDHDKITADPAVSGILFIAGAEKTASETGDVNDYHMNLVGTTRTGDLAASTIQASLDSATTNNEFIFLDHPYESGEHWFLWRIESSTGYYGMEVWNGIVTPNNNAETKIDSVLSRGFKVYLIASDDTHDTTASNAATTALYVYANANTNAEIMENLKRGNFYASQGALISSISVSSATITVTTPVSSTITFIGDGGLTKQTTAATTAASYTVGVNDRTYIRVKVTRTSDSKLAWTNPIYLSQETPHSIADGGLIRNNLTVENNLEIKGEMREFLGLTTTNSFVRSGLTITRSDFNLDRSTNTQIGDTSAFQFLFTGVTGKPQFYVRGPTGNVLFKIDSAGLFYISDAGGASTPSITFYSDPNTGIYTPAADAIAITAGGRRIMTWDKGTGTGQVSIGTTAGTGIGKLYAGDSLYIGTSLLSDASRNLTAGTGTFTGALSAPTLSLNSAPVTTSILGVKGTNAKLNLLELYRSSSATAGVVVDSNFNVGIGTTSPTTGKLVVNKGALDDVLALVTSRNIENQSMINFYGNRGIANVANGNTITLFYAFGDSKTTANAMSTSLRMVFEDVTHATRKSGLAFYTQEAGSGSASEHMRITGTGNVGIGTTGPTGKLDIQAGLQLYAQRWLRTATGGTAVEVASIDTNGNITARKVIQDSAGYAGVYIEEDTKSDSIIVSSSATYYTLGAVQLPNGYKWTTNGASVTKNCTIQDSSITINSTGVYQISYVADGKVLNMATGNSLHMHIFVDNVVIPNGASDSQVSASNAFFHFGGVTSYYVGKAGTIIKLKVNSPDDAAGTIIFHHANLIVTRVPQ